MESAKGTWHARHPLPGRTWNKKHVNGLGGAFIFFGSSQHRVLIEDSADISAWLRSLLVSWTAVCSYWKPGKLSRLGQISSQLIKWKVLGRCQIRNYVFAIKVICSFFFCHLYFSFENVLFKYLFQGFYCLKKSLHHSFKRVLQYFLFIKETKETEHWLNQSQPLNEALKIYRVHLRNTTLSSLRITLFASAITVKTRAHTAFVI